MLAQHMGQVLFVVEASQTSHRSVQAALELIYDHNKVMMVLNKYKSFIGTEAFGDAYYYYKRNLRLEPEAQTRS